MTIKGLTLSDDATATLLGYSEPLTWQNADGGTVIDFPDLAPDAIPSPYAHVVKLTDVGGADDE